MIWREKRVLLISLGALVLLNVIFFVTYRVRYQERIQDLDQRLEQAQQGLDASHLARLTAQASLRDYQKLQSDIRLVYEDWWSTPDLRLAPLIVEVRRLAETSGLVPRTIQYSLEETTKELGADAMTINFAVQGPYVRARQLINLIELSDQFVTIDSIGLGAGGEGQLTLALRLRTLFRDPNARKVATRRKAA